MLYIFMGCLGFLICVFYDLNQIHFHKKLLEPFFAVGCLLVVLATVMIAKVNSNGFAAGFGLKLIFGGLALVSFWLMVYSLFFALPFSKTYLKFSNRQVYDKGVYALCRHPGVLWFIGFYLFFWLFTGKNLMFWAFLSFSLCNLIYIWLQDRYFFPKLFKNYAEYKETTPFLFPNPVSVKNCFNSRLTR